MLVKELFEVSGVRVKSKDGYRLAHPMVATVGSHVPDFDSLTSEQQDSLVDLYHWLKLNHNELHDKDLVLKKFLAFYNAHHDREGKSLVRQLMHALRSLGYDYPELKTIEKSMDAD